jgi:hypothetical protein
MDGNGAIRVGDPTHFWKAQQAFTPTNRGVADRCQWKTQSIPTSILFQELTHHVTCHFHKKAHSQNLPSIPRLAPQINERHTPINPSSSPLVCSPLETRFRRGSVLGFHCSENVVVAWTRLQPSGILRPAGDDLIASRSHVLPNHPHARNTHILANWERQSANALLSEPLIIPRPDLTS